ncbi:MAG: hypothetical protein IPI30_23495 [Saprospiraceae bacterium]|nr:hypothetical protein [Candidatus Vicinibacter affinis]
MFQKHFTFKLQCDWLIQAKNVHKIEHDVTYSIVRDNARTCKVCGPLGTLISDEIGPYEINPEPFICPYRIIFTTNILKN